jgi:flagellar assembly protein FliH
VTHHVSPDPQVQGARPLRRLGQPLVVATNYENRSANAAEAERQKTANAKNGYDEGYAEGLAKASANASLARDDAARRAEAILSALERAIEAVRESERRMQAELRESVPQLAFDIVEALLGREASSATDPGRDAIVRALSLDSGTEAATIRLNPLDLVTLGDLSDLDTHRELRVMPDATVERGGALVDLGNATVDSQLGTALERVKRVLVPTAEGCDDRVA